MRNLCLAVCLLTGLLACSRGGSATRDAGGGAPGPGETGGTSIPVGGATGGEAGSGGVAQIGSSAMASAGSAVGAGGADSGGVASTAGRTADSGGSSAAAGAAGADGGRDIAVGADGGRDIAAGADGGRDTVCGVQIAHASRGTPDVLLVLDRSATMNYGLDTDCVCAASESSRPNCPKACKDRWSTLVSAVGTTIASTPNFHWGLKLFYTPVTGGTAGDARASNNACNVGAEIEVPVGPNAGSAIMERIQATLPEGSTPTQGAIVTASAYLKTVDDQNSKFIVLATDGEPNCPPGSRTGNESDMRGTRAVIEKAGFPVYVLGIGPSLGSLEELAIAGGTGHYYPATSPDELAAALSAITGSVATCTFTLSTAPPGANNVTVYLDQTLIARDDTNGWGFASDTRSIVLHGESCKVLKASNAATLTVHFNCPSPASP